MSKTNRAFYERKHYIIVIFTVSIVFYGHIMDGACYDLYENIFRVKCLQTLCWLVYTYETAGKDGGHGISLLEKNESRSNDQTYLNERSTRT